MSYLDYQEIFLKLRNEGFKINEPLKWSFFFFDKTEDHLKRVISELDGHNYKCEIEAIDEEREFRLIATKVEILTPEKLKKRQDAFHQLAAYCNTLYDGWEVSK